MIVTVRIRHAAWYVDVDVTTAHKSKTQAARAIMKGILAKAPAACVEITERGNVFVDVRDEAAKEDPP